MNRQTAGNPDYHRSGWLYGSVQGWHHRPDRNGLQRIVLRFPCNLCTASDYSRRIQNLQAAQGRKGRTEEACSFRNTEACSLILRRNFLTQVRIYIHIYIQTKYIQKRGDTLGYLFSFKGRNKGIEWWLLITGILYFDGRKLFFAKFCL